MVQAILNHSRRSPSSLFQALNDYNRAQELSPHLWPLLGLAFSCFHCGQLQQAAEHVRTTLQLDASQPSAWILQGWLEILPR